MKVKVSKWGNSVAIRLPKSIVNDLNLDLNSVLDIFVRENQLVATKTKKKYSLSELLEDVNETNIHNETDTGVSLGNEF